MWIADKIYYQNSSSFTRAYQGSELVWEKPSPTSNYITFTAKANSSSVGLTALSSGQTLEYSTDGNTWSNMTTGTTITLNNSGDSVYVRGILSAVQWFYGYTNFTTSGNLKLSGNINYLWNKDNPDAELKQFCGYGLFSGCTALSDVSELELPATTLVYNCYASMFNGCTSLTAAPVLPATTLASHCYFGMFTGCVSLTTAPVLPATTLASNCYMYMFNGCTSLTAAPALPATTLASECYRNMFWNCSSLTTAPALPATALTNYCYAYMFQGCTSLTSSPELPATTLVTECYRSMFYGCSNLNYIKCLATDISASNCTYSWVNNVSGIGTFVKASSMSSWATGINGIPSGWTVENT